MPNPDPSIRELLDAIDEAHHAIKRLREAATLCDVSRIASACGASAVILQEELAYLERVVAERSGDARPPPRGAD